MFDKIKKIFKKKPKVQKDKRTYEKAIDHGNDITFENEVKKPQLNNSSQVDETVSETKSETKFG